MMLGSRGLDERLAYLRKVDSLPVDIAAAGQTLVKAKNAKAVLAFSDRSQAQRVLAARDPLILAEAYLESSMEIKGDVYAAIELKEHFFPDELGAVDKARIVLNFLRSYRRHSVQADRRYIAHHYEHPDDFYRLFLGRSMAYSCAYFAEEDDSLDTAQERKIAHLLAKLRLKPNERLLDVGCGWGTLAITAARDFGAYAVGVTLSHTQHAHANRLIQRQGLGERCRVELMDYRELDEDRQFDKVASVGMYEHVGRRNLSGYFKKVHSLLRPEGLFVNHGITRKFYPDWRKASEGLFIDKYIFPGGEIHASSQVIQAMEQAGFEIFDVESLRKHYAKTLRHWVDKLQRNADEARRVVPESVFRAWVLYMAGCALGFDEGYLNVHQICGSKTESFGGSEIAMTRHHLYK
jgi:cyclopropane-fatty-acyl-phospholipid synthase